MASLYRNLARFVLCEFLGVHGRTEPAAGWTLRQCTLCGDLRP